MDEPENYAAPVTETRVNPFDAGYRRAWKVAQGRQPSVAFCVTVIIVWLAIVGVASIVSAWRSL